MIIMNPYRYAGFTGVLDTYTGATGGRSVAQRLTNTYEGALIEVRESGGDTLADIGFDATGELDQAALLAHCGSNDGFVRTIYDQVGAKDAVQTTNSKQGVRS